jgi:hypothetical protein
MRNNQKVIWNDNEIQVLIDLHQTTSNNDLSKLLNKTSRSIGKKLKSLNLYRTKVEKDFITGKACKLNGRDLTFEYVKNVARRYNTRHEFYLKDPSAYSAAIKNKWLNDICQHMIKKKFSIPQLILKDILEFILKEKCSFNDRNVIYPLEIDCYFVKWKIGWEYDGKYYHNDLKDHKKRLICKEKNILLFNINENNPDYRNPEKNIKNQLITQLDKINEITGLFINQTDIITYKPVLHFPNLLTGIEKELVWNKKISEIKVLNFDLFKRIKKYKIYEIKEYNIINDLRKNNRFNNFQEYKIHLDKKDYKNFEELCKYEHPHRVLKKWNLPINLIHQLFINESTKNLHSTR